MSRYTQLQQLAPPSPPCFESRMQWVEYCRSASQAQIRGVEPGPLIFEAGQPVRFDFGWSFCDDCDPLWRRQSRVEQRGICRPEWLKQFETPEPAIDLVALCRTPAEVNP